MVEIAGHYYIYDLKGYQLRKVGNIVYACIILTSDQLFLLSKHKHAIKMVQIAGYMPI